MMFRSLVLTFISIGTVFGLYSQTLVNYSLELGGLQNSNLSSHCGSYDYMEIQNQKMPGFLPAANGFMQEVKSKVELLKSDPSVVYEIPVVFHIVYNNEQENIPDSVIYNQLDILNESYRRTNGDTVNTRPEFLPYVGDSKIQFKLADLDPFGNPTNGITRTSTDIEYFGGTLPYGQGQNQEIADWVNDSLFLNFFRITDDVSGGKTAWDVNRYLNIWVGDLRIFEPQFGDFEELVYFGLATPPQASNPNWADSILHLYNSYEQGVIMHYINIGSNNSNQFPYPYNGNNGVTNTGKILVHEIGHYLGLRHIWGDGDCSVDDFIADTPNSNAPSNWNCSWSKNTCVDDIDGVDLPDMVENYMDYSSGNCQNSFTKGQIDFMRYVLENFRPELLGDIFSMVDKNNLNPFKIYPNPTTNDVNIYFSENIHSLTINLKNIQGQLLEQYQISNEKGLKIQLDYPAGVYFLEIIGEEIKSIERIIKQ